MSYHDLSEQSKDYINRYVNNKSKTIEQALQEKIVQEVIKEYETGTKDRMVFA